MCWSNTGTARRSCSCRSIAVSKRFAELCRERGLLAEHVDGQTTERQATLGAVPARRDAHPLTNAMLLTEGYDEPSIDCVVCLRPTKVRALYSQIIGRGTRIWPGKDHLLVLDFLWQAGEHSLMRPANLIAEDEADAKALTDKLGGEGDLEEAREEVNADRTRSLTERLRAEPRRVAAACSIRWSLPSRSTKRPWRSSSRPCSGRATRPRRSSSMCWASSASIPSAS